MIKQKQKKFIFFGLTTYDCSVLIGVGERITSTTTAHLIRAWQMRFHSRQNYSTQLSINFLVVQFLFLFLIRQKKTIKNTKSFQSKIRAETDKILRQFVMSTLMFTNDDGRRRLPTKLYSNGFFSLRRFCFAYTVS